MLQNGIIDETKKMLNNNFSSWAPLSSVGYKEVVEYLNCKTDTSELFDKIVRSTMQLIKKQKTWFKRDLTILWSDLSPDSQTILDKKLDQFLTAIDPPLTTKR